MSRIDEALRRLAGAHQDPTPQERDRAVAHASVLEHYPEEENHVRPVPEPARSAAAPLPVETRRAPHIPPRTGVAAITDITVRHLDVDGRLVISDRASPEAVLQYRRLADALQDLKSSNGLKRLMVASARTLDGRTLTAVNLGFCMSEYLNQRVLLIDADLRKPSLDSMLALPNRSGLSEFLRCERDDVPLIPVTSKLCVVTAGRPVHNAMAALVSDRMEDLIDEMAHRFDWVFVDAPPVELMSNPQLFAGVAGSVLFVIRAEATPRASVRRAIACLDADRIVGTVLNGVMSDRE